MPPEVLLRMLEQMGVPKGSKDALVSEEEQEQLTPAVRVWKSAETIKALRVYRGLTRAELAERAGISERQLARIEARQVDVTRNDGQAKRQMIRLAEVLRVTQEDLRGNTKKAKGVLNEEPKSDPVLPISASVSALTRLGFAFVRLRYGWSIGEVVELAPLMFALLAEGSLARRRGRLDEMKKMHDELPKELQRYLLEFREQSDIEERSIGRRDLRDEDIDNGGHLTSVFRGKQEDPFSAYLIEFAQDQDRHSEDRTNELPIPPKEEPRLAERWLLAWMFREEMERTVGKSERARWALEYGDVNLFDIPQELRFDLEAERKGKLVDDPEEREHRFEKRVEWLESKLSREVEEAVRRWRDFSHSFRTTSYLGMKCQYCHQSVESGYKYCPRCGQPIQAETANISDEGV